MSYQDSKSTVLDNQDLLNALNDYVYVPIKWATPILFILLTSVDFAKVVFAGKKEYIIEMMCRFISMKKLPPGKRKHKNCPWKRWRCQGHKMIR